MIFLVFLLSSSSLFFATTKKYNLAVTLFVISLILLFIVFIPHTIRHINIQL
jgi:heme O synthase-like polyprenyltransferase